MFAAVLLLSVAGTLIYRTHRIHIRRTETKAAEERSIKINEELNTESIIVRCSISIQDVLHQSKSIFNQTVSGLVDEDRKVLKNARHESEELNVLTKKLKNQINLTLSHLREDSIDSGHYYVQAIDYLREINHCISYIINPSYEHVENNHRPLVPVQIEEISRLNGEISFLLDEAIDMLKNRDYDDFDRIISRHQNVMRVVEDTRKKQVKRIKSNETGTRNSILYLNMLAEIKNLSLFTVNLLKSSRELFQTGHSEHLL
jgi:Na+/phosphate symporter